MKLWHDNGVNQTANTPILNPIDNLQEMLSAQHPGVRVTGPRHSGEKTLAKAVFPEWAYVSLEKPEIREFVLTDPWGFNAPS